MSRQTTSAIYAISSTEKCLRFSRTARNKYQATYFCSAFDHRIIYVLFNRQSLTDFCKLEDVPNAFIAMVVVTIRTCMLL